MNKLVSTLLAGAAALALSGGAFAAEEAARNSGTDAQNQNTAEQSTTADQTGTDRNNAETSRDSEAGRDSTVNKDGREAGRESPAEQAEQATGTVKEGGEDVTAEGRDPVKQEYEAELTKCDSMTESQKQVCIEAAKKKHGQM